MPIGYTQPGSAAEDEWQKLRDRLLQAGQSIAYNPYQPGGANVQPSQGPLTQSQINQAAPPSLAPVVASNPGVATSFQATQAASSAPAESTAPANNASRGPISKSRETKPGQYYSDYPDTTIGKLRDDPETAAREWSKFYKYGGDAYSKYMSSVVQDPMSVLKAMGVNAGSLSTSTDTLDWYRRLWDTMSGRSKDAQGNNFYIDPHNMVSNILGAKFNKQDPAGSLGTMLNDPSLLPEQQVQNTINLLLNSLQGTVSDDTLNAYASSLKKLGQDFLSIRNKNPASWGTSNTFNHYVASQLGSGGGIF